jgi:Icc-related predicted phosphoesterase
VSKKGRTTLVNPGCLHDGNYAVVTISPGQPGDAERRVDAELLELGAGKTRHSR